MSFRMRDEPDCNGRCACSQTVPHSAIAAITGARKSFGCGLVNRIRSRPDTASHARRSSPNSVFTSGRRSRPHELTFWPSRVISRTPSAARRVTSAMISPGRRDDSRPRTAGTMQYEHFELHPIEICTQAWNDRSRCIGSAPAKVRSPRPKRPRATPVPPAPSHSPRCGIDPGPKATSTSGYNANSRSPRARGEGPADLGVQRKQPLALRLGVAAADRDHGLGVRALLRDGVAEMGGEPRVRLLADRAGVEHEHVSLRLGGGFAEPELLEHPLDPLRVVRVHLAAECGDVVAPHGREWYRWPFRARLRPATARGLVLRRPRRSLLGRVVHVTGRVPRDVDGAALADHSHLDLPRVVELVFDLAGDLVRQKHCAVVVDLAGMDDHADLAAGLERIPLLDAGPPRRQLLERFEPFDVVLEALAARAGP